MSDSKWIQKPEKENINFGLLENGSFVIGKMTPKNVEDLGKWKQLISGFIILVENGKNTQNQSDYYAPRTAIGFDIDGNLLSLEVDGAEFERQGATTYEMAELLIAHGAYHAINLDGGGSSTVYYDGKVISYPTCHDVYQMCERNVTTIICIKSN